MRCLFALYVAVDITAFYITHTIVENMLLDAKFMELSLVDRQRVLDRLRNEIRGRMMEDIILLETRSANPEKYVFKL